MIVQAPEQNRLQGRDEGVAGWEFPRSRALVVEEQGLVLLSELWQSGHPVRRSRGSGSGNWLVLQQQQRIVQILKQDLGLK